MNYYRCDRFAAVRTGYGEGLIPRAAGPTAARHEERTSVLAPPQFSSGSAG
jgi:hypothetical protein